MTSILILSKQDNIARKLRQGLAEKPSRIVVRDSLQTVSSAIRRNAFDVVVIDGDAGAEAVRRRLRELVEISRPACCLVLSSSYDLETENAAFESGADLYFSEPFPTRSLEHLLRRTPTESPAPRPPARPEPPAPERSKHASSALVLLRDFSHVLRFSLDPKAFAQNFIQKLRDHISFSRIAIFIESSQTSPFPEDRGSNQLVCMASFGLPADLIECFQLSKDVGIGRSLSDNPRILRCFDRNLDLFDPHDSSADKEFGILGCQIAIPISDRERTIGAAVLNGPVTGREYTEEELQLLYLLMEELGIAVRNSRLHTELAAQGRLIEDVMASMASGAIVVTDQLEIRYANGAAKRFFQIAPDDNRIIDFAELPPTIASIVHRAVEKSELPEPTLLPGANSNSLLRVSVIPFREGEHPGACPRPVLLIMEDFTAIEAAKRHAQEDSRSELLSILAERFAHEIRNSLVPLTTHMQLIDKKIEQPKFQASLKASLARETERIKRFSEQMLYLSQNSCPSKSEMELEPLITQAFNRVRKSSEANRAKLNLVNDAGPSTVSGNQEAISYVFTEIFLNSIQAMEMDADVDVHIRQNDEGILFIRIKDSGPGFSAAIIGQATEPFFTTRNTGVGLGLAVANKIVQEHHGFLRLNARSKHNNWDLEIELPGNVIPA